MGVEKHTSCTNTMSGSDQSEGDKEAGGGVCVVEWAECTGQGLFAHDFGGNSVPDSRKGLQTEA